MCHGVGFLHLLLKSEWVGGILQIWSKIPPPTHKDQVAKVIYQFKGPSKCTRKFSPSQLHVYTEGTRVWSLALNFEGRGAHKQLAGLLDFIGKVRYFTLDNSSSYTFHHSQLSSSSSLIFFLPATFTLLWKHECWNHAKWVLKISWSEFWSRLG